MRLNKLSIYKTDLDDQCGTCPKMKWQQFENYMLDTIVKKSI